MKPPSHESPQGADTEQRVAATQPLDIEQFKLLYNSFSHATPAQLPSLYDPNIHFKDPVHELKGLAALAHYFASFCAGERQYRFEFTNQLIAHNQAFLQWQMHYAHPQLARGKALMIEGGTLIKFTHKIIYHEDFYDMGAMIYQHLPVLGWAVKKINSRIADTHHD